MFGFFNNCVLVRDSFKPSHHIRQALTHLQVRERRRTKRGVSVDIRTWALSRGLKRDHLVPATCPTTHTDRHTQLVKTVWCIEDACETISVIPSCNSNTAPYKYSSHKIYTSLIQFSLAVCLNVIVE